MQQISAVVQDASRNFAGQGVLTHRRLWIVLLALSIGDILTTVYGLSIGAVETNPVAADLIASYGLPILVPLKLAFLAVLKLTLQRLPRAPGTCLLAIYVLYFGMIVASNVSVLGRLHGVT